MKSKKAAKGVVSRKPVHPEVVGGSGARRSRRFTLACATRLNLLEPLHGRILKQAKACAPSNNFGMLGDLKAARA